MSMYALLFGSRPDSEKILALVGLKREDVPRFRDVFISEDDEGPLVAVYTRMGGGNRGHWEFSSDSDPGPDCTCFGCRAIYYLAEHENYVSDKDDDYDETYATYFFRPPEIPEGMELKPELSGEERWDKAFELLGIVKD